MFVWLESLFIGSYVYHSDVIAGMQLCYQSSEIIQSTCTYYSPFIIHTNLVIQLSQCSSDKSIGVVWTLRSSGQE